MINLKRLNILFISVVTSMTVSICRFANAESKNFSSYPQGLAVDEAGNIFASNGYSIMKFDNNGNFLSQFGEKGHGNGQFINATGVTIDKNGNIWVIDTGNDRVEKFDSNGKYLSQFGSHGSAPGQFIFTGAHAVNFAICVTAENDLFIVDSGNNRVQKFSNDGKFLGKTGSRSQVPSGVAVDVSGNIWITENFSNRILIHDKKGILKKIVTFAIEGDVERIGPKSLAVDGDGTMWMDSNSRLRSFNSDGKLLKTYDLPDRGHLVAGSGVAFDKAGNIFLISGLHVNKFNLKSNSLNNLISDSKKIDPPQQELNQVVSSKRQSHQFGDDPANRPKTRNIFSIIKTNSKNISFGSFLVLIFLLCCLVTLKNVTNSKASLWLMLNGVVAGIVTLVFVPTMAFIGIFVGVSSQDRVIEIIIILFAISIPVVICVGPWSYSFIVYRKQKYLTSTRVSIIALASLALIILILSGF